MCEAESASPSVNRRRNKSTMRDVGRGDKSPLKLLLPAHTAEQCRLGHMWTQRTPWQQCNIMLLFKIYLPNLWDLNMREKNTNVCKLRREKKARSPWTFTKRQISTPVWWLLANKPKQQSSWESTEMMVVCLDRGKGGNKNPNEEKRSGQMDELTIRLHFPAAQ